jgi:hypothetical protein
MTAGMEWRQIKLFISSTFRDMYFEREYLVKQVLWELKSWCAERKIVLDEIDLRWGVTEHMAKTERQTIVKCLDGVDEARPFFLCFLGQYRGWTPREDELSPETFEKFPALKAMLGKRSATEMEILHATSPSGAPACDAVFFRRDPSYLDNLPSELADTYTNHGLAGGQREIADAAMAELVESTLPQMGFRTIPYTAKFKNNTLTDFRAGRQTLACAVFQEFKDKILDAFPDRADSELPADGWGTAGEQERLLYLATLEYIDRGEIGELTRIWRQNRCSLLVFGNSGMGKSALFAQWVKTAAGTERILYRFCRKNSVFNDLLAGILEQLGRAGAQEDTPALLDRLALACGEERVSLAIDGLEHFQTIDATRLLSHAGLRVFGTANMDFGNGKDLRAWADTHAVAQFDIAPFGARHRAKLAEIYLKRFLKALDHGQMDMLLAKAGADNPLFLKIILSEIRVFGSFEGLSAELENFGDTAQSAFGAVLSRLERDYDALGFGVDMIARVFSALAISEDGITAREWSAACGVKEEQLYMVLRQIEPYIDRTQVGHDSVFSFGYEAFAAAAHVRYSSQYPAMHQRLYDVCLQATNAAATLPAATGRGEFVENDRDLDGAPRGDGDRDRDVAPRGKDWSGALRELEKLFAHAVPVGQADRLALSLKYLGARIERGGFLRLTHDLARLESAAVAGLRQFLLAHASNLRRWPDSLLSLLLFEGGELTALAEREKATWPRPCFSFGGVKLPAPPNESAAENGFTITETKSFPSAFASDILIEAGLVFRHEKTGAVSVYDAENLEGDPMHMQIERGRVLALHVSQSADFLAVAYEDGHLTAHSCSFSERRLNWHDEIWRGNYFLPEANTPVFLWDGNSLLFQSADGALSTAAFDSGEPVRTSAAMPLRGELSALLDRGALAVKTDGASIVCYEGKEYQFRYEISCMCKADGPSSPHAGARGLLYAGGGLFVAAADGSVFLIEGAAEAAAKDVKELFPQKIHVKAMCVFDGVLHIVSRGSSTNKSGRFFSYDNTSGLKEIAGSNELYPKTDLSSFVKAGFSSQGQYASLTNTRYFAAAPRAGKTPRATVSHVFSGGFRMPDAGNARPPGGERAPQPGGDARGNGLYAILRRGDVSFLCREGGGDAEDAEDAAMPADMREEPRQTGGAGGHTEFGRCFPGELNIKWTHVDQDAAVGISRTGGAPLYFLRETGSFTVRPPEVMSASAAGGWLLGESGQLYRVNSEGQLFRHALPAPRGRPLSVERFNSTLCLHALDTSGDFATMNINVFQIAGDALRLKKQLSVPADMGHYQCGGADVDADRFWLFLSDGKGNMRMAQGALSAFSGSSLGHARTVPAPFLHNAIKTVVPSGDIFYILEPDGTLHAAGACGARLCSLSGVTAIDGLFGATGGVYVSAGGNLLRCLVSSA